MTPKPSVSTLQAILPANDRVMARLQALTDLIERETGIKAKPGLLIDNIERQVGELIKEHHILMDVAKRASDKGNARTVEPRSAQGPRSGCNRGLLNVK